MTIEVRGPGKAARVGSESITIPGDVPQFSLQDIEAAVKRSRIAFRVREEMQGHVDHGTVASRRDVASMLKRAHGKNGKPDVHAAAVIAYYARRHPRCFAKDAGPLVTEYLKAVDKAEWARLVADLEQFIARLNEQRKEDERLAQVKKARDKDDLEHDDKKRALVKDNGTKADRQRELQKREQVKAQKKEHFRDLSEVDHEEELTSSGKVRLSEKELTTLKMTNKGFSRS
ncbi:MAG: hypothetical protein A2138_24800 [Deltaproteobacteria bacterium RBG_16_71_12]|nr:MAG: hypothetical protein A2138_24800 [Deltaproteobacteria bacterium RBG_16_71_12]